MDHLGKQAAKSVMTDECLSEPAQEWRNQLRSAIHPAIFAAVYRLLSGLSWVLHLSPTYRADLLVAAPKVTQAIFAALGDYYTWKLGERVYGSGSNEAWAAVCCAKSFPSRRVRALANC